MEVVSLLSLLIAPQTSIPSFHLPVVLSAAPQNVVVGAYLIGTITVLVVTRDEVRLAFAQGSRPELKA